uniref:Uncharacterized protein n=1 Tax=Anguilla anguilla TaxID=7936 RepID=A0A0E9WYS0_ANGAN
MCYEIVCKDDCHVCMSGFIALDQLNFLMGIIKFTLTLTLAQVSFQNLI